MEISEGQRETTMRDYLRVIFRQKMVIIVSFVTVVSTVFIGLKLKTPVYESSVKMLISAKKQVDSLYYRDLIDSRNSEISLTQSELVKSSAVIGRVVKSLALYDRPLDYEKDFASGLRRLIIKAKINFFNKKTAKLTKEQKQAYRFRMALEDLKKNTSVEPIRDTDLFTIKVRDFSPLGAAVTANVVSRSYVIFDLEQQLVELELKYGKKHPMVTQLRDNIAKVEKSLTGAPLPDSDAIGPATVKIIEQAQIPIKPVGPSKMLIFLLSLFMAPLLGVMLAFVFEYTDQSFKSAQDIEGFLNLPFLGSIPRKKRRNKPGSFYAKSYQVLSDQIYLLLRDKNLKSLMGVSSIQGEGATTVIANLGKYLSQKLGHKVLIIDANLRNSSMHKFFNISQDSGLTDVLEGKASFEQVIKTVNQEPRAKSHEPRANSHELSILPTGSTELNPITLLGSSKMEETVRKAEEKFEIVLVDCADLRSFKDANIISKFFGGVLLILSEGKSRKPVVKSLVSQLIEKKVNILGVVLNNRSFPIPGVIYDRV
ncbi:MAG: lipopolysaccharide biosynthesis protein [Spirochaetes bacterium]|nr:MAG: lipopolysaccharide biosynthesis protein [Spirochaetota bacterium]